MDLILLHIHSQLVTSDKTLQFCVELLDSIKVKSYPNATWYMVPVPVGGVLLTRVWITDRITISALNLNPVRH